MALEELNKWLKFTLKVAETFVKFAIPPPMIRIFPVNKHNHIKNDETGT